MIQIRRRRLFWSGTALFVVGLACLIFPAYGRYCEGDNPNDYYCAAYSMALAFGAWTDAHGVAITALGTIAIAWFTWTLRQSSEKMWIATRQAADAADLNAKASVAAQSPRLIFSGFKLVRYLDKTGWVDQGDKIDGSPYGFLRPLVQVTNAGVPIMGLHQFCIDWTVTAEPPPVPVYKKVLTVGHHLDSKVSIWLIDANADCFELSDAEITAIQRQEAFFWMYGWVSFLNHITNEVVTHGFIGRYSPTNADFFLQGPAAYTFVKRTSAGS